MKVSVVNWLDYFTQQMHARGHTDLQTIIDGVAPASSAPRINAFRISFEDIVFYEEKVKGRKFELIELEIYGVHVLMRNANGELESGYVFSLDIANSARQTWLMLDVIGDAAYPSVSEDSQDSLPKINELGEVYFLDIDRILELRARLGDMAYRQIYLPQEFAGIRPKDAKEAIDQFVNAFHKIFQEYQSQETDESR